MSVNFGAVAFIQSNSNNKNNIQSVKDGFLRTAINDNHLYLDAAVGMHPIENPADRNFIPQAVILTGADAKKFLVKYYNVNPYILTDIFLSPEVLSQLSKIDTGIRNFTDTVNNFFKTRQHNQYTNQLPSIQRQMFEYAQNEYQQNPNNVIQINV